MPTSLRGGLGRTREDDGPLPARVIQRRDPAQVGAGVRPRLEGAAPTCLGCRRVGLGPLMERPLRYQPCLPPAPPCPRACKFALQSTHLLPQCAPPPALQRQPPCLAWPATPATCARWACQLAAPPTACTDPQLKPLLLSAETPPLPVCHFPQGHPAVRGTPL